MENAQAEPLEPRLETPLMENQNDAPDLYNEPLLDQALNHLQNFLRLFGFYNYSLLSSFLSCSAFILIGISIPVTILSIPKCSRCERFQIVKFELSILVFQTFLAAVSLLCISNNLRRHGLRKFLFVDRQHGQTLEFRKEYMKKIQIFFHMLFWCISPCLLVKAVREIVRLVYVPPATWWLSIAIFIGSVASWSYLTTIFLSSCSLFCLVCNLQIIHFDDYGKLLERDLDVSIFIEEHIRLRHHLSKISHRFRMFLLLTFLLVTVSLSVILFQTTGYRGMINVISGGDLAVSSVVQVLGVVLCLHAAAKISHRAQSIGSVASKWHALVTCNVHDSALSRVINGGEKNAEIDLLSSPNPLTSNYSESDLESMDSTSVQISTQHSMPSFHKRQALVNYLQTNLGGLTIYGWTVDRALITTIFFIELSLILFILGKTIVFSK